MKSFIYLMAISCFFTSCKQLSNKDAEKIVTDFMNNKNTHYDGAGVTKPETITITQIEIETDSSGYIDYTWSGKYMDAVKKNNTESPKFFPVKDMSDRVMIEKEKNTWNYSH